MQAILWYYEKRLYAELGARATADISYAETAREVIDGSVTEEAAQAGDIDILDPDGHAIDAGRGGDQASRQAGSADETTLNQQGRVRDQLTRELTDGLTEALSPHFWQRPKARRAPSTP
jgi:hypothetical protein